MKRFTDTDLWDRDWFMQLPIEEKLAFFFIKDKCDRVGVWKPNFPLAEFVMGTSVDWGSFLDKINQNIEVLPDGKWWLVDFCDFQYGQLKETCAPHRTYKKDLIKHGLLSRAMEGYEKGINTLKEEEEEKDKDKDKEKEQEKNLYGDNVFLSSPEYQKLKDRYRKSVIDDYIERLDNHIGSKGDSYKSHYHTLLSWLSKDKVAEVRKPKTCKRGHTYVGDFCRECWRIDNGSDV